MNTNIPIFQSLGEPTGWRHNLKSCVTFLLMAQYSPGQHDMLQRLTLDEKLDALSDPDLAPWKQMITQFTTTEIIRYPLEDQEPLNAQLRLVGMGLGISTHLTSSTEFQRRRRRIIAKSNHNLRIAEFTISYQRFGISAPN